MTILVARRPGPGHKWVIEERPDEELQSLMDELAVTHFDPARPPTPPFPDHLLSTSLSPLDSYLRTSKARTGRGK